MILFRSKFYVNDDWTLEEFISFFFDECLSGYELETLYDDETDFETKLKNNLGSFQLLKNDSQVAIRMTMVDDAVSVIDTYVYDNTSRLLFAERNKECTEPLNDKFCHPVPNLIKPFFWGEYAGYDGEIFTDNKSLIIRRDNIKLSKQLFMNELDFMNPIVYVSCNEETGNYSVNYEHLASDLAGMAHVLVEGSPVISSMLRLTCPKYGLSKGDVVVFFPTGDFDVFEPSDGSNLNITVRKHIVKSLISVSAKDEFKFDKIRERFVLNKLKALAENQELSQIYEDILSEKDTEVLELKSKLEELERENSNLKYKCSSIQSNLDNYKDVNTHKLGVNLTVTEHDLYDGEICDVLLKLISKEYNAMSGDKNTRVCRKAIVLKNILDNNNVSGKDEEIKSAFKGILGDGIINNTIINDLERIGFNVVLDTNNHYKLMFNNDDRFKTFMACTRSDHRGNDNMISDFMNTLFGY